MIITSTPTRLRSSEWPLFDAQGTSAMDRLAAMRIPSRRGERLTRKVAFYAALGAASLGLSFGTIATYDAVAGAVIHDREVNSEINRFSKVGLSRDFTPAELAEDHVTRWTIPAAAANPTEAAEMLGAKGSNIGAVAQEISGQSVNEFEMQPKEPVVLPNDQVPPRSSHEG